MGKRRRSPRKLFSDGVAKRGCSSPEFFSDGFAEEATMGCEPVAMGSPSSAAVSALVMADARGIMAQGLHSPTSAFSLDEATMRDLAMLRARDILAKELDGLVYVDCVVTDVAGGEKAGLIKLIIK